MAAVDEVDAYLESVDGLSARRLSHGEWGITVLGDRVGGDPIEASLRIADGLLRAQAFALPARDGIDPWLLLHWNRQTRLVRIACARSGDIWVHGDLPVAAVDERSLDRLLGLVVEGAVAVRNYAATASAPPA